MAKLALKKAKMKAILKILFLCVFIQIQSGFAAKNAPADDMAKELPELAEWLTKKHPPTPDLSYHQIEMPELADVMQYCFCIDTTTGKNKIIIRKHVSVPIYGLVEDDTDHFEIFDEVVGEWDVDDPYVQKTFEFIDDYTCRYRDV